MSTDAQPVAPGVAAEVARLEAALGVKPTLEPLGKNTWHVTFQNERVVVTFDLQETWNGYDQLDSTLTVDGKSRRLAQDLEQLTAFFNDTTATLEGLKVAVVVPPEANPNEAPALVRHLYAQVGAKIKKGDAVLQLSCEQGDVWVIGVYVDDRMIELRFVRRGKKWGVVSQPHLVLDGEDWSDEVQTLDEAMRLFMGGMNPQPADTTQFVKPRGSQSTPTSVQVRTTKVIRT